jgi:pyridine nucleotide-disulfide oxidoreductase
MNNCDVAIIGAGPYGLSVGAHLQAAGVNFRIFGEPMEFWLKHMPKGMHLKSEGFASSLFDAEGRFPLAAYCKERGIPYADIGMPVPLEVFTEYGLEFQRRYVPNVERRKVNSLQKGHDGFTITLDNGEVLGARRVVIAVGLKYYEYLPQELASLPGDLISHSAKHTDLEKFRGREVTIVGAGASALDLAALLHEVGASVQVAARVQKLKYHDAPNVGETSWFDRLRAPVTGIGLGWKLWMCTNLPLVFRLMPEQFRIEKVRQVLGPAPCWFIKDRVEGKIGLNLGVTIKSASARNGRAVLELADRSGAIRTLESDHVIAATGYTYQVNRLSFLTPEIVSGLRCVGGTPRLSTTFESTIPNLYFVGITAANTFGPLLRFAFGAGFAAPRISSHLARTATRSSKIGSKTESIEVGRDRKAVGSVAE